MKHIFMSKSKPRVFGNLVMVLSYSGGGQTKRVKSNKFLSGRIFVFLQGIRAGDDIMVGRQV